MVYWYILFLACLVSAIFIASFLLADFYYSIVKFFFGKEERKYSKTRFAISATIVVSVIIVGVYYIVVKVFANV